MFRVGIIPCSNYWKGGCPGYQSHVLCFLALELKKGPLGELPGAKIVAMQPCPGCPGTGRLEIARRMVYRDKVEYIVFPSCIFFNNYCPTALAGATAIEKELGCPVLLGSYLEAETACRCSTVILKPDNIPSLPECQQRLLNLNYLHYLYNTQPAFTRKRLSLMTMLKAF
ncbi:CGGC domain-containing protein [Moorella sulfitireducens]|uniref:CGGC domain-containing protein n=1 Tax=Neomoorella sulfitireducens TaxID=2972948 RepID=UPI0021ABCF2A|nr:CGGC domain-containing protein [Moorella sulfitireducens]